MEMLFKFKDNNPAVILGNMEWHDGVHNELGFVRILRASEVIKADKEFEELV